MNYSLEKRIEILERAMKYVSVVLKFHIRVPRVNRDEAKNAELMKRLSEEGVG